MAEARVEVAASSAGGDGWRGSALARVQAGEKTREGNGSGEKNARGGGSYGDGSVRHDGVAAHQSHGVDKLSYEIFSLLESKFLFGPGAGCLSSGPGMPARAFLDGGRVWVLAIDGCGAGAEDALLAAAVLARLEAGLREQAGDHDARVAGFFDLTWSGERTLRRVFGNATLRDTVAPLLVPCYDLATAAPVVFSRADTVESDGFDFRLRDVCATTCAAGGEPLPIRSVNGRTAIAAASAGVAAMGIPAAAAITHVFHNKQEFPLATGVEDLLVLSISSGASVTASDGARTPMPRRSP
ncbi:patatin-like protein 3 [Panicum miliaceum]|uniref:Patatin-like protein 3 n=1 Tax=Panicum miliaceum TaxID=4540 RepID=A0A3L6RV91_PANMI|nr:patatin-like protein 3 [Panicum miliaceum]